MALHLITGYAGEEHITSADQGAYNMGTFGEGEFVLDRGSKFAATVVTNNQITIANGEALMQGRFIKLSVGTTESVSIDNGTSGMKRKDLIVLRYSKDAGTGIESVVLAVKKGTPSSGTPSDPALTTGTITDGTDLVNEMPLYRVNLDGLNIASIDTMFSVKTTMVEYMDEYQLPVATASVLGGVKKGTNVNIDANGVISVPSGDKNTKGLLRVGDNINVSSNVISVYEGGKGTKGVLSVGSGLSATNGIVSVGAGSGINVGSNNIYLKTASTSEIGGIVVGPGMAIRDTNKLISKAGGQYEDVSKSLSLPSGWSVQSGFSNFIPTNGLLYTMTCYDSSNNAIAYGFLVGNDKAVIYNPSTSSKTMKKYTAIGFTDNADYK